MKTLPAAIEFQSEARRIDQRRPPWVARVTLYTVVAVIVSAIGWAALAKIDRIVVAPGKLITTAPTIVLAPFETGIIRTLDVRVGDLVHKGQPLATLDSTLSQANVSELQDKVSSFSAEIERLRAQLNNKPYAPAYANKDTHLQLMVWTKAIEQYRAKVSSFDEQIRQVEAEIQTKAADRLALKHRLIVARQLEDMRAQLMQKEVGSKVNYLEAKSQRLQIERDMELDSNEKAELKQNADRIEADKSAYIAEFRHKAADELVQARRQRDSAAKQLEKASRLNAVTILRAPADSVVLEMAQRSVGSVMKAAEPLYTLVPLDSPLEADVKIESGDIGYVSAGQNVRLKLTAWPFQKHGTLAGKVFTISDNSFTPESDKNSVSVSSTPYYKARIKLLSNKLRDVPTRFRLIPGMAVTAEIKVGKHSVLSYFLYPLRQGLDEGIREP